MSYNHIWLMTRPNSSRRGFYFILWGGWEVTRVLQHGAVRKKTKWLQLLQVKYNTSLQRERKKRIQTLGKGNTSSQRPTGEKPNWRRTNSTAAILHGKQVSSRVILLNPSQGLWNSLLLRVAEPLLEGGQRDSCNIHGLWKDGYYYFFQSVVLHWPLQADHEKVSTVS